MADIFISYSRQELTHSCLSSVLMPLPRRFATWKLIYALLNNKRLIIPVVHISTDEKAAFAIIGIAIPFVVTLISAFLIFYFTLQEWGGTMVAGSDSLAGMPGILSAWMGGCSSGFVILSIRYLIMRSPKNKLT